MTGRWVVWGSGVAVVLGSALGWLTNELNGGWPWWVATALVTVVAAALAMWLASQQITPVNIGEGAVFAGRDLRGRVRTRVPGGDAETQPAPSSAGWQIGRGAVVAGRDLDAHVDTDVTSGAKTGGSATDRTGPVGPTGLGV